MAPTPRHGTRSGATGNSFTLHIPKYPSLPVLALSNDADLCDHLRNAAVVNFQQPNEIHFPGKVDGFVRRLDIRGAKLVDLRESGEMVGMNQVSVIALPVSSERRFDIVFAARMLNYITYENRLFIVSAEQLAALKGALENGGELPSGADELVEMSAPEHDNPIQVLEYSGNYYLAEEQNWSEIKLSKILPGRPLEETCLLKFPIAPPVGPAFDRWLGDIEQVQGQEGPASGSGHFLDGHLRARAALAQLAASRPADIVQFGLYSSNVLKDQWSPLQAKLGLALWGLAGPWNHLKLKRLQADTESAETALVDYYIYTYGVEAADAAHAAGIAVDTILKESFYFYDYGEQERKGKGSPAEIERGIRSEADNFARLPMDQRDATYATDLIRAAILAGASKSDIATLIAAGAELGGRDTQYNDRFPDAKEPALFFSLERPEIVALLIKDGVDANQTNAFGKTALMYAAHLNLDDTVELLLGAKAAVNATTTNGPALRNPLIF